MRFLSTRWRRGAAVVVGVPLVGLGGLSAYVQYRQRTRPARHIFRPLVDAEGNLVLEGKVIPRPNTATVVHRSVELVAIFAPMLILYFLMSWNAALYDRWLRWMVNAVERAGPVFVKIGQWACTREDLFSPKLRSVLKRLYNEVEVHPFPETMKILEEELGCDPYTVFDSIETTTVGSGSIGQVHLARIKNTQDRVVIKVMHPNIIENITVDFCILHRLAKTLDEMFPSLDYYDLKGLSSGFTSHLAAQLDFRIEAENLEQFRANFERTQFVRIPKPIISTQRVLVETFCEGEPANPEYLASLPRHARDVLAGKGLNTWCQMLLRDNFIHGDMHPGNILIDGSDVHEPQVTLIDVGLCQQLTPRESEVTHMLMDGFVRWSSSTVAESLWNMSSHQRFANREKFDAELDEVFTKFRPAKNDQGAVTNVLQAIFECVRENSVQMEPPYVSLLFAVLVLESFIMNLNPEFNMVRHAAPWLVSEGFISKGVIKNWLKTRRDAIVREYGILRGRMGDGMELEKLEGHQNVRMSLV